MVPSEKQRFVFLDIARGLAILEMINGHCLHALLSTSLRDTGFMMAWNHVRGFTAPFFLFVAGFASIVATVPALDDNTYMTRRLVRRILKILFIILIGYLLHLPFFSLRRTISTIGSPAWDVFLNVDILQCIGVSLLLLQLIYALRLKATCRMLIVALITAAVAVISRYVSSMPAIEALPAFIKSYIVRSSFPLFPFSAYLFFGALCGEIFIRKKNVWTRPAMVMSVCLIALSFGRYLIPGLHAAAGFLLRSGILLVIVVLLYHGESVWRRLPSIVKVFCMESLVLYVLHLFIIYGSVFNNGLSRLFGKTLSYPEVYGTFFIIIVLLTSIAYAWHTLKRVYPYAAFSFRYALYLTFAIRFLMRPY